MSDALFANQASLFDGCRMPRAQRPIPNTEYASRTIGIAGARW